MNRKVTWAKFHQALFIPGVGTIGDVLPSLSKSLRGLEMTWVDSALLVRIGSVEAAVPHANIVLAVFDSSAPAKPVVKAA